MSKRSRVASPDSSGSSKRRRLDSSGDSSGDSEASSRRRCSEHVCSHQDEVGRLKRKIKRLILKKKTIKSVTKKLRKKIESLRRDQNIQDILCSLDSFFSAVLNQHGEILWYQADALLQRLMRDVIDEVTYRWANRLHLPILNLSTVKVRDNKAFIPRPSKKKHCRPIKYALRFLNLVISLFGPVAQNEVMEDFVAKLSDPKLSLLDFQNLYFHQFLQSREQITAFPGQVIDTLQTLSWVTYNTDDQHWIDAYKSWLRDHPQKEIDLKKTCAKNEWAKRALNFRPYSNDDPIDELFLVRNFIAHFNQCRAKDVPTPLDTFDKVQIGEVVFDLFPHIVSNLFDFMYTCGVYMDFLHVRTYYSD